MNDILKQAFAGRRVLVTGHTGFKGGWLSVWLEMLGARVTGVAIDDGHERGVYALTGIGSRLEADLRADVRDAQAMRRIVADCRPEVVFHLAAQPLVRLSYEQPAETFMTNVMGTVNVLEAIRAVGTVRAAVMVTSDKCYENNDGQRPFTEDDPMGGYDPYSASKGAAELAIAAWRRSFRVPVASVRAGNVIGGGDWAADRIVPDCIRAIEAARPVALRNPDAVRPWQHVLEPLGGYLLLATKMLNEPTAYCEGWNFGPAMDGVTTVGQLAEMVVECYGSGTIMASPTPLLKEGAMHEAQLLTLDITKAQRRLGWQPRLDINKAVAMTVDWYRRANAVTALYLCRHQISQYAFLPPPEGWGRRKVITSNELQETVS